MASCSYVSERFVRLYLKFEDLILIERDKFHFIVSLEAGRHSLTKLDPELIKKFANLHFGNIENFMQQFHKNMRRKR
jgi:hypothetical protein